MYDRVRVRSAQECNNEGAYQMVAKTAVTRAERSLYHPVLLRLRLPATNLSLLRSASLQVELA
jgi:hypothetical protein